MFCSYITSVDTFLLLYCLEFFFKIKMRVFSTLNHDTYSESDSNRNSFSFNAPLFNPLMSVSSVSEISLLSNEEQIDDAEQPDDGDCEERVDPEHDTERPADVDCEESTCVNDLSAIVSNISAASTFLKWLGFKIVIDNIDKNLRRSFQRSNNKTVSMHAYNMYACLDQIDYSSLPDVMPSDPLIDIETLLIGKAEIDELSGDVEVLLERYVICNLDNIVLV